MDFAHINQDKSTFEPDVEPITEPTAWLDMDALEHNIQLVNHKLKQANDERRSQKSTPIKLRLASKSIRSLDVMRHIQSHSPDYIGIMSYSAKESVYLLKNGFDDILCAYPTLDMASVADTFSHVDDGCRMVWMADRAIHLDQLNQTAKAHDTTVDVCLDINMSMPLPAVYFGTKRSGLMGKKDLKKLLSHAKNLSHIRIVGVMGYEAQIAGLPEKSPNNPMLAPAIRLLKNRSKKQVSRRRTEMVKQVEKWLAKNKMPELRLVNGGGSGSLEFTASQLEVTEITVGSAYYKPAYFDYMDSMAEFHPSAGFVLPVTRQPESGVITCHAGGFIASGASGIDKSPVVHYPQGLKILPDEGFGEVQTPMAVPKGTKIGIGDAVWCRHAKAGELCEHFNELVCFQDGKRTKQTMMTYRGNGQCFH